MMSDLRFEYVEIDVLSEHPDNPRVGSISKIARSIEHHGFIAPIIAQRSTGRVIAGNHRLKAAKTLGLQRVPVVWVDIDDEEAQKYLLADNRAADGSLYDKQALQALLIRMPTLVGTGWERSRYARERLQRIELRVPDAVTVTGNVNHQILRCDSAEADVPLDDISAALVVTDPPWDMSIDDALTIIGRYAQAVVMLWPTVLRWPHDEWHVSRELVWVHERHRLNRFGKMNRQHAMVVHAALRSSKTRWVRSMATNYGTKLAFSHLNSAHDKPLELFSAMIDGMDCSFIVDPFMGSGASIIAADRAGIPSLGIERNEYAFMRAMQRMKDEGLNVQS